MYEPPPGSEIVLKAKRRDECMEFRLVLEAVGISAEAVFGDELWMLIVDREDLAISNAELESYRQENLGRATPINTPDAVHHDAAIAVLIYAAVIIVVFVLSEVSAYGFDWLLAGRMQAGSVMSGQWWRTLTALTLHLDVGHLLSNLIFGGLFGFLAGQILGGGVAWLAILIAGALGNFMNAIVQAPTHISIGASTAVFGALGVIVAQAIHPREFAQGNSLKRWSPLVGGVLLLAFIGVGGERTDVMAHLTGFLAGLLVGSLSYRVPARWLVRPGIQRMAGMATLTLIAGAWIVGLLTR